MKESEGVVRTCISLPRALKEQMEGAEGSVNWSAVAAGAFELKLKEIEAQKETKSMEDVIARMKAADELDSRESYQNGRRDGEKWAREVARPKELRRLEASANEVEDDLELYEQFFDERSSDSIDEDEDPDSYAKGFIEGALAVWDQVKAAL